MPKRSVSSCDVRFRTAIWSYHWGQGCDLGNCVAKTLRFCVCVWKATIAISAASYRGANCPTLKTVEKQPKRVPSGSRQNSRKTVKQHPIVTSVAQGTKRLCQQGPASTTQIITSDDHIIQPAAVIVCHHATF